MMKNMMKTLFVVSVLSPIAMNAQNITIDQERLFNLKVLEVLDIYERNYNSLDDPTNLSEFKNVFKNSDVMVYNDLIGLSDKQSLSVTEYVELLKSKAEAVEMKLIGVRKGAVVETADGWQMTLSMKKRHNYVMGCDLLLDSYEYYKSDYDLNMTFQWNTTTNECLISSIEGGVDSKVPMLGENFVVLEKKSSRDEKIYNGSTRLKFNTFDQCLIPNVTDKTLESRLSSGDPDFLVRVKDYDPSCHKAHLAYKSRRWQLRPHYDITFGEYYKLDDPANITSKTKGKMDVGLDVGGFFPTKSKLKIGLFVGVGFSKSQIDLSLQNCNYQYTSQRDVDNDMYIRRYNNLMLQQTVDITELKAPLYLDFDFRFSRWASIYLTAGAEARYNLSANVHLTSGSSTVYGIYPQYGNLVLDHHYGFNGFGQQTYTDNDMYSNTVSAIRKFNYDLVGGAGLRFNIPFVPLSIDVGVKYAYGMRGLTNQSADNIVNTRNAPMSVWEAPVHNEIYGTNNREVVRSLTDSYWDIKRRALRLQVGLIYKF